MIIDAETRNKLVQAFKELGEITRACAEEINKQLEKLYETTKANTEMQVLMMRASFGDKEARKKLNKIWLRDSKQQIIRARQRQQLLRENQDKSNNWKRIHGLPATRKNGSKTKQSIAGTRQKGIET
nr:MAG: hypothetical protein [Bacteriophage sp.]